MVKKSKTKKIVDSKVVEADSAYFLKIVLYLILGSLWLRIGNSTGNSVLPLPLGLCIGLIFATHEHFAIDKKVEFAVLLVSAFIAFWLPIGVNIAI